MMKKMTEKTFLSTETFMGVKSGVAPFIGRNDEGLWPYADIDDQGFGV